MAGAKTQRWVEAPGGVAWKQRPLRLGAEPDCVVRAPVQQALNAAGIDWEMEVELGSSRTNKETAPGPAVLRLATMMRAAHGPAKARAEA